MFVNCDEMYWKCTPIIVKICMHIRYEGNFKTCQKVSLQYNMRESLKRL